MSHFWQWKNLSLPPTLHIPEKKQLKIVARNNKSVIYSYHILHNDTASYLHHQSAYILHKNTSKDEDVNTVLLKSKVKWCNLLDQIVFHKMHNFVELTASSRKQNTWFHQHFFCSMYVLLSRRDRNGKCKLYRSKESVMYKRNVYLWLSSSGVTIPLGVGSD